jgi:hypothetical protein
MFVTDGAAGNCDDVTSFSREVVKCGAAGVEGNVDWIGEEETDRSFAGSGAIGAVSVACGSCLL